MEDGDVSEQSGAVWGRLWTGWSSLLAQVERLTRRADSEDLLHDAFVRMAARKGRPDNEAAFLLRSAVNRGRDAYRREKVRGTAEGETALATLRDEYSLPDEALIARMLLKRVGEGIERLPPRTREVFLLQRMDNLKYRDIAQSVDRR